MRQLLPMNDSILLFMSGDLHISHVSKLAFLFQIGYITDIKKILEKL